MDPSYVTALAAIMGSVVGSATSLGTTFLTQHAQRRLDRLGREVSRREHLYGAFIDEAAKLYAKSLGREEKSVATLVEIVAELNRMRLFSSPPVLQAAEEVIFSIVRSFALPERTLADLQTSDGREMMLPLSVFGDACRKELDGLG